MRKNTFLIATTFLVLTIFSGCQNIQQTEPNDTITIEESTESDSQPTPESNDTSQPAPSEGEEPTSPQPSSEPTSPPPSSESASQLTTTPTSPPSSSEPTSPPPSEEPEPQSPAEEPASPSLAPEPEVKFFTLTAKTWSWEPATIKVKKGDIVKLTITSVDVPHGFSLPDYGINQTIEAGQTSTIQFTADKAGTFTFACSIFCGEGHSDMKGTLIVE